MAKISKTDLGGYDYHLPQDQIAQFAFHPRDHCKLLVLKGEKIDHQKFYDIIDYLDKDDVLVLNETKVSRTKLIGKKATGTPVEIMLLKPVGPLIYQCNIKGKRLQVGNLLLFAHNTGRSLLGKTLSLQFSSRKTYTCLMFQFQLLLTSRGKFKKRIIRPYLLERREV